MSELQEYDVVRVDSLKTATPSLNQPAVGDEGTILNVLAPNVFIVEAVGDGGSAIWISDFHGSDLTLVWRPDS